MTTVSENFCRFCIKEARQDVKMIEIDENIEQLFYDLTQYKLTSYANLHNIPNSTCEECYKELTRCIDIRKSFIDKQAEFEKKIIILLNEMEVKHEIDPDATSINFHEENKTDLSLNKPTDSVDNTSFELLTQAEYEHNELAECPTCFDLFEQSDLLGHIQTHSTRKRNRFGCDLCAYSASKSDRLQKHYQKVHNIEQFKVKLKKEAPAGDKKQQCAVCGSFVKNLAEHLKFTHNQAKKSFFCDHCSYSCYFKTKIERHLQKHIPKEFRNLFQCSNCEFLCSRKDALKSHMLTMHQVDRQKSYTCPHCRKNFYNISQLNIHIKSVHQNIRNHLCQQCGKGFFTSKDLAMHAARHFEKKEKCTECEALFFCKVDLQRHFRHKHKPASIVCQVGECQRKFHTNSQLKIHIKTIHENLKEYICSFCGACFGQYNNMKRHIDSVHKALRIHCPVDDCEYSITRKDKYKMHLIKVHKNLDDEMRATILKNVKFQ